MSEAHIYARADERADHHQVLQSDECFGHGHQAGESARAYKSDRYRGGDSDRHV
jgi:hypothetical protein